MIIEPHDTQQPEGAVPEQEWHARCVASAIASVPIHSAAAKALGAQLAGLASARPMKSSELSALSRKLVGLMRDDADNAAI